MKPASPHVPFVDLSVEKNSSEHREILSAISDILQSGQFICGREVRTFEKRLADYCGTSYAVSCNSGTDALFFALKSLGIGVGDEVILPANVFWAVANSVVNVGATPVFADVDPCDMLLSAQTIAPQITRRTKAIICVHLTGMPCRMDAINALADEYALDVIEDAAQALGALYRGKKAGSIGRVGCFSFHPLKNVGCIGDGGALVTDDADVYHHCMQLRNHGLDDVGQQVVGYNSRLDEIQAAVLSIRLRRIDEIIDAKRALAARYQQLLPAACQVVVEGDDRLGVYQLFMIQCDRRDQIREYLISHNIQTGVHYPTYQHLQKPYRRYESDHLENTDLLGKRVLSLPIRTTMGVEEVQYICRMIGAFYDS